MQRLIIIGGGFAGAYCAKRLQHDFAVTLIDQKDFFEYTPGILRAIRSAPKLRVPHRRYLRRGKLLVGKVTKVTKTHVTVGRTTLPYDYLIVATGARYVHVLNGSPLHAATGAASLRKAAPFVKKSNSILIIGGGLVGVELAGELLDGYSGKRITLVHGRDLLLERQHPRAGRSAERYLRRCGVSVLTGEFVERKHGGFFITRRGTRLHADIVFLATGTQCNSGLFSDARVFGPRRSLAVNAFLQLSAFPTAFAAGDVTSVPEEKTAHNAMMQARVVADNVRRLSAGKPLRRYRSKPYPLIISLGSRNAILAHGPFVFTGVFPALLKRAVEFIMLHRYR